jgi:energy-coupling factor transporter ATP-binding protein EcfA2
MTLEKGIVEWSATRDAWQQDVLRRVVGGVVLNDTDYDTLVEGLLAGKEFAPAPLSIEQLPEAAAVEPPVTLVSVDKPQHVNALASDTPLALEPTGITIIYGKNGSGKSGYARLLKQISRSRHREGILSDVFHDSESATPKALIVARVDTTEAPLNWPEDTLPELRRILFYDKSCGDAYTSAESDFPYRPSALFVMDGLIEACVAIRSRIDVKLAANSTEAKPLPVVLQELIYTPIGKCLANLAADSALREFDAALAAKDSSDTSIATLKASEATMRLADPMKEKQKLLRLGAKFDALKAHVEQLDGLLNDAAISTLDEQRGKAVTLDEAAALLAKSFETKLAGAGTEPWLALWKSARKYSEEVAYPTTPFPVVGDGARCVLCQQELTEETSGRLARFEKFVVNDIQKSADEARATLLKSMSAIRELQTTSESIKTTLADIEAEQGELVKVVREQLEAFERARSGLESATAEQGTLPRFGLNSHSVIELLDAKALSVRTASDNLSDPQKLKTSLTAISVQRAELELLAEARKQRSNIVAEMLRLKKRAILEAVKSAASTTAITKKVLELSESGITKVVRDRFTRECDRLRLERVTIDKKSGGLGAVKHQPTLVGARQSAKLPSVLSEGERTALGLAAFFTEAELAGSKSAIILDDPVSSLDHVRRGLVAARLAELAKERQVIVFTHDVSFIADLKKETKRHGVAVCERSVVRSRGDTKKPGTCRPEHPWHAKDVGQRLHELRVGLARIKREMSGWDEDTYEKEVSSWAGGFSETLEYLVQQELVGPILGEGGTQVHTKMLKVLTKFSPADENEFEAMYSSSSQWAKRHVKSPDTQYVAPDVKTLEEELARCEVWSKRVKQYR